MGGLREDEAAAKLRSELAPRLARPVKVRVRGTVSSSRRSGPAWSPMSRE